MEKRILIMTIVGLTVLLSLSACSGAGAGGSENRVRDLYESGFSRNNNPGDIAHMKLADTGIVYTMIYANDTYGRSFPQGTEDLEARCYSRYYLGQTEVTNNMAAAAYQWAVDRGTFSKENNHYASINSSSAEYGKVMLLDFQESDCQISFDENDTVLSVESGYENHPVSGITWFGSIMLCNWLTEMRDGSKEQVVYTGIEESIDQHTIWQEEDIIDHPERSGYRLPDKIEWEFAARYRGSDSKNSVNAYSKPYFTRGDSASAADSPYSDDSEDNACEPGRSATAEVAVYGKYWDSKQVAWIDRGLTDEAAVKSLGPGSQNALGLYDMSGNVAEWIFELDFDSYALTKGGSWRSTSRSVAVGEHHSVRPRMGADDLGLRLCRTVR